MGQLYFLASNIESPVLLEEILILFSQGREIRWTISNNKNVKILPYA